MASRQPQRTHAAKQRSTASVPACHAALPSMPAATGAAPPGPPPPLAEQQPVCTPCSQAATPGAHSAACALRAHPTSAGAAAAAATASPSSSGSSVRNSTSLSWLRRRPARRTICHKEGRQHASEVIGVLGMWAGLAGGVTQGPRSGTSQGTPTPACPDTCQRSSKRHPLLSPKASMGRCQPGQRMTRLARAAASPRAAASCPPADSAASASSATSASASSTCRSTGCSCSSWCLAFQVSSDTACSRTSGALAAPPPARNTSRATPQAAGLCRNAVSQASACVRTDGSVPGEASSVAHRTKSASMAGDGGGTALPPPATVRARTGAVSTLLTVRCCWGRQATRSERAKSAGEWSGPRARNHWRRTALNLMGCTGDAAMAVPAAGCTWMAAARARVATVAVHAW